MKTCKKCGVEKEIDCFPVRKSGSIDGYRGVCKECKNKDRRKYYTENKTAILESNKKSYFKNHEYYLEYRKNHYIENIDWYKTRNRSEEYKEAKKEYYSKIKHTEKYKSARRIVTQNRRKNTIGVLEQEEIKSLIKSEGGFCFWCGSVIKEYHLDHVYPISKGGINHIDNICISCENCNKRKSNKHPIDFAFQIFTGEIMNE